MKKQMIVTAALCLITFLCSAVSSQPNPNSKEKRVDICLVNDTEVEKAPEVITAQSGGISYKLECVGQPKHAKDKPEGLNAAGSLFFNGDSQYHVKQNIMPLADNFSLEVYVKAEEKNHPGLHAAVAHGDGRGGYMLAQQNDQWVCFVGGRGAVGFGQVTAGQWEHLKITVKTGTLTLFRNGSQVATSDKVFAPTQNFSIGGVGGHHKESFSGNIAAVGLSSRQIIPAAYINTWLISDASPVGTVKSADEIKTWRYFDDRLFSRNYDDYQDLRSYLTVLCKQKADSVEVWARTHVYSPTETDCQLCIGADNECDAFLNGQRIGGSNKSNPDRDSLKWPVKLINGWNELVVRVGNRKDGRLGFYARLTDSDNGALTGLIISPEGGQGRLRIVTREMNQYPDTVLPAAWCEWPYVRMEPLEMVSPARFPVRSRRAHGSAFVLCAAGGKAPYSWTITKGELPKGIMLKGDGVFSGTVSSESKPGNYIFTVSVTDMSGIAAEKKMVIKLNERPNKRAEEQRLIGLIHRPEHTPEGGFDDVALLMKRQGYQMGMVIGYNNGAHTYRWPTKTGFRPLNGRHPDAPPIEDIVTPYKKALEKQGLDFGFYMGNFNGPNHDGADGMVRVFEEVIDAFSPRLIYLDWALWQGTSLDAAFSAVRARDPYCVLLVNQAQANCFGNGDWDLTCMEGWGAWGGGAWHAWPYELKWPKKHSMETWRLLPDPNYECTPGLECDWQQIMRVTLSIICEGYIADIDHSPTTARKHTYITDRLKDLEESHVMRAHRKMADWTNPKGQPPLYTAYTHCNPGPVQGQKWGYSTISLDGKTVYLHVMKNQRGKSGMPEDGKLILKDFNMKIRAATCMNNGLRVPFAVTGTDAILDASAIPADPVDTIIQLDIDRQG